MNTFVLVFQVPDEAVKIKTKRRREREREREKKRNTFKHVALRGISHLPFYFVFGYLGWPRRESFRLRPDHFVRLTLLYILMERISENSPPYAIIVLKLMQPQFVFNSPLNPFLFAYIRFHFSYEPLGCNRRTYAFFTEPIPFRGCIERRHKTMQVIAVGT